MMGTYIINLMLEHFGYIYPVIFSRIIDNIVFKTKMKTFCELKWLSSISHILIIEQLHCLIKCNI